MKKTKLIAFMGPAGAGKDTAYEILKKQYDVPKYSLAAKLKNTCAEVLNIDEDYFHNPGLKDDIMEFPETLTVKSLASIAAAYGVRGIHVNIAAHKLKGHVCYTPREILQTVGTEFLRGIYPGIHYGTLADSITEDGVITDIRFIDEYNFFKAAFDLYPFYIYGRGGIPGKHSSEATDVLAVNAIPLYNDGTIFDLKRQMEVYIHDIFK